MTNGTSLPTHCRPWHSLVWAAPLLGAFLFGPRPTVAQEGSCTSIEAGQTRTGLLQQAPADTVSIFQCFELIPTAGGVVVIDMRSGEIDSYLEVFDDWRLIAEDDDSGGGLDARLSIEVDAGDTLEIHAMDFYREGMTGSFTLRVSLPRPSRSAVADRSVVGDRSVVVVRPPTPRDVLSDLSLSKRAGARLCDFDSDAKADSVSGAGMDHLHPSHFVRIVERTWDGGFLPLFRHNSAGVDSSLKAGSEVDERSTIVVRFDREHLENHANRFDFEVSIVAMARSGEDTPPVEVLGYHELGEEAKAATASIVAASELIGLMCGVGPFSAPDPIRQFAELGHVNVDTLGRVEGDSLRESIDSLRALRENWKIEAAEMGSRLVSQSSWADGLDELAGLDQARLEPLASLGMTTSSDIVARFAKMKSSADSIRSFARRDAAQRQRDIYRAEDAIRDFSVAFQKLDEFLGNLEEALTRNESNPSKELMRHLLHDLRDAEIPLLAQGIRDGSTVALTVSNAVNGDQVPRAMLLQFSVRRFGTNALPTVRDSFLFLNRFGVPRGQPQFNNGSDVTEATAPRPAHGLPTAGSSAFWSYYPRGTKTFLHRAARLLKPGVGINVSFVHFGTTMSVTQVTNSTSTESIVTDQSLGLGVGGLLLLRDGLVQLTFGHNFGVSEKPWYWGLGFSFIEVAERAGFTK